MPKILSRKTVRVVAFASIGAVGAFSLLPFGAAPDENEQQLALQAGFIQGGDVTVSPLSDAPAAADLAGAQLPADPSVPPLTGAPPANFAFLTPEAPDTAPPAPLVTRADTNPAMQDLTAPAPERMAQQTAEVAELPSCSPDYRVSAAPGGMADIVIDAPCHAAHAVTLAHAGLAIDDTLSEDGHLSVSLPVLDSAEPFTATLDDGVSAQAVLNGASATAFDHVVLQWHGDTGLQLHALEFGAEYGDPGHIWTGNPQAVQRGLQGKGGFLNRLGNPKTGGVAEVYSFPVGQMGQGGSVALTVEAEITAKNCGNDITGQVLQRSVGGEIVGVDVSFAMPGCDAVGDILVLKNILQGLKIAAN